MEAMPLLKYLVEAGFGARRQAVSAIKLGRVTVNGRQATGYTMPVYAGIDEIACDGKQVALKRSEAIVLMVNKPAGVLSTRHDEHGRRTVEDIIPAAYRSLGLYPAGRLDYDTTGLLVLTNDGSLTYRLTHPRFEHEKEYYVQISGTLSAEDRRKLEKGLMLEDGMTAPARLREVGDSPPFNYSLTIHEGRNRQVRRMFAELGHTVGMLKRVRIGRLQLGGLETGEAKRLSETEVGLLLGR